MRTTDMPETGAAPAGDSAGSSVGNPAQKPADLKARPQRRGLVREAMALRDDLVGLARDQLALVALETRLAVTSLVTMLVAGVVLALLLVSAWLGLLAAAVLALMEAGLAGVFAILFAVLANVLAAGLLYLFIRKQSGNLRFAGTLDSVSRLRRVAAPSAQEVAQ